MNGCSRMIDALVHVGVRVYGFIERGSVRDSIRSIVG